MVYSISFNDRTHEGFSFLCRNGHFQDEYLEEH